MIGPSITPFSRAIPGQGGPVPPYWLWYESFLTDDAAPVASSAAANPGPGTTHFSGSTGSISSGQYNEDVGASAAGPYQNTGRARGIGLAAVAYGLNWSRITSLIDFGFSASAGFGAASMRPGMVLTGSLECKDGVTSFTSAGTNPITTGNEFDLCVIADATGGFGFYKASASATWTLAGVTRFDVTATIYARMRFFNAAGVVKAMGLAAGVAMPQKYAFAASGAQGALTLPAADFMAAMRLTTTADNGLKFRVDDDDYFLAQRTNAGQLNLTRYDAGSPTSVVQSAMTAAVNDRIYVRLEGNVCRLSGHPTGGTWVNVNGGTITQHTANLGVEVLDEDDYDSLEIYPLTHSIALPHAA